MIQSAYKLLCKCNFYIIHPQRLDEWASLSEGEIIIFTGAVDLDYVEVLCAKGLVWIQRSEPMARL